MSTTKQLAKKLDGRFYGHELTHGDVVFAQEHNLVIVFGYSDDNMGFHGAIDDEVSCFDGGDAFITSEGLLLNKCDCEDCPYHHQEKSKAKVISAIWCPEGSSFSWEYKTDIPHETFDIHEANEPYCVGIVFDLSDV